MLLIFGVLALELLSCLAVPLGAAVGTVVLTRDTYPILAGRRRPWIDIDWTASYRSRDNRLSSRRRPAMARIPTDREPTHPGEMLLQQFLLPLGMIQRDPATAIHVPFQRVNEIVRGRRGHADTALRLSQVPRHVSRLLVEPATPLGPVPRQRA